MSVVQGVVLVALVGWALYHTLAEVRQDKRIDRIEAKLREKP